LKTSSKRFVKFPSDPEPVGKEVVGNDVVGGGGSDVVPVGGEGNNPVVV
jgi:hypothetical protein